MTTNLTHAQYMQIAVQVGMQNLGRTGSNPSVGAVITEGNLVATGITGIGGTPHAEPSAIEAAKKLGINLTKATLYVTLEPCSHHGKTPPCCEAIVRAKIPNVFIGIGDPDARVNGRGIKFLRKNSINVDFVPLNSVANLHRQYIVSKTQNRPFVTLKIAASLDGKIALQNGESKWVTSQSARNYTNFLRSRFDGILVGANTVRADSPILNCRTAGLETFSPRKFIASKNIFHGYENVNGECNEILTQIKNAGVQNLLVEGGANLITQFLKANLFDELILITAPIFLGSDSKNSVESLNLSAVPTENLKLISEKNLESNLFRLFSNVSSCN